MGAAALWRLASRGARVLGLEQFTPGHARGSSHGQTRLIRQAYFEHPDYVPLLRRAYALWHELQTDAPVRLLEPTGLVIWGPPEGGRVLPGVISSAQAHGVPIELLNADEASRRFPLHRPPAGYRAVWEPGAGFLRAEACVSAMVQAAEQQGAQVHYGAQVTHWQADGAGVAVEVGGQTVRAARLILAQGAWSGPVLRDLGASLNVRRNALVWLRSLPQHQLDRGAPCFAFDLPAGFYYGFPALDSLGVKAALHAPGLPVLDVDTPDLPPELADAADVRAFAGECLAGVGPEVSQVVTCRYELSPDDHFVVDLHPHWPQVVVAGGFSGHGFKFAPVIGEALADLALVGASPLPIGFLAARRFASQLS